MCWQGFFMDKKVNSKAGLVLVATISLAVGFWVWSFSGQVQREASFAPPPFPQKIRKTPEIPTVIKRPTLLPVDMARLRKQGCVADGLLSEYNPDREHFAALVNRSHCYYLHRAIETWLKPPDFATVHHVMGQISSKDVVYGMFLAEALDRRALYFDEYSKKQFDFDTMCRQGSINRWGEHSCVPNLASAAYRDYLRYITRKAMDLGVQSFTFGQIYMQEGGEKNYAPRVIKDMRAYADEIGLDIVIGAQTGHLTDPAYLALFDYIEGGVGMDEKGNLESGPCLSWRGGCWALLWHQDFSAKAKNVLLHLDWSGIRSDDLDKFARMSRKEREETLRFLHKKFDAEKTGFLLPLFGVLDKTNGGCHGPKKRFYSADKRYSCADEGTINAILQGK